MITLYGRRNSANVQKVLWALNELGLEYGRVDVGGSFGQTTTAEYKAMNPNSKVPVLKDGDLVLFESNTIVRYLAARYGQNSLWPSGPGVRATMEKWMDWQLSTLDPVLGPTFMATIKTPPIERDAVLIATRAKALIAAFDELNTVMAKQPYLSGENFGLADIVLGTMLNRYHALPIDRPAQPHLDAWFDRLEQRPAFRRHVMVNIGTTPEEWTALEQAGAGQ